MRARACFAFSLLVLVALRSVPGSAYTPSTTSGRDPAALGQRDGDPLHIQRKLRSQ